MNILVIDVGGSHVKILATGRTTHREFESGLALTPKRMVSKVSKLAADWRFDAVSIGYPGLVRQNRPVLEPWNLGKGWVGFNFKSAFKRPVKMLFLGLGTGLGSALIVDGMVEPLELAHLPYKKGTFEDYVGIRGLEQHGKRKWRKYVADVVARLTAAFVTDEVVLGGGNVRNLKKLPTGCRAGKNANAFRGGFRMWEKDAPNI